MKQENLINNYNMEDYNNIENKQSNDIMKQLINLASDIKEGSIKPSGCGINIHKQLNDDPNNANKEFFKALVVHYTTNIHGGYNGKRQIKTKFVNSKLKSDDDLLSEHGYNDSFVKHNLNDQLRSDSIEEKTQHSRISYKNKEASDLYKTILNEIENVLGVDTETAKLYRLALKIYVTNNDPELKKRKNDLLKMQKIKELITTKKDLKKIVDSMDIEKIKNYMEERKKENESKFRNRNAMTTSEKTTSEKTKKNNPNVKVSEQSTENKKNKKNKKNETGGYLQSSEIIFSPE